MALPGNQMRTWTLFVCLSWMFVGQVAAEPQYLVAMPTVIEPGTETKFCASLLQPSETLVMTITLISGEEETTLLQKTSSTEFHECFQFQAPLVQDETVQMFRVRLKGDTFHSEEVRKVLIKDFQTMTFIQTDKPLYLPGQTVHFRVVTLDTKFRPASGLYNTVEIQDSNYNRIGQWLNTTSNGKILQLSYSLNSEAREGTYRVHVWINGRKISHSFRVEKYVLPKFDVKVKASDGISIGQEEVEVEVCSKYTYGQPVPASVELEMCRPLNPHVTLNDTTSQCHQETKRTEKNGCATFMIKMSTFTKLKPQLLEDELEITAEVEEDGTGIKRTGRKTVALSYIVGKLSFIETPKFYKKGSILEGKVKVVNIKDEPVPDMPVYLFDDYWMAPVLRNLTTDSNGIATFTINTTGAENNIRLRAALEQDEAPLVHSKIPHYENERHVISLISPPSPRTKSSSSLEVKGKKQLPCDKEENFSIQYTFVGETRGSVDVMYLVLTRGTIVMQGHQKLEVPDDSVTEGEISFVFKVTSEVAPEIQIVAYTILPNEIVIAHSASFLIEKCFRSKVSLGFNPTSAVPGEGTTLQVSAQPGSLCGISIIDQSVLIEEPGKTLDADKIFNLLPDKSFFFHHANDPEPCLNVRHRRSYMYWYREESDDSSALGVFQRLGLKIATNVLTKMPLCVIFKGKTYYDDIGERHIISFADMSIETDVTSELIWKLRSRTFFPETWIWNLVEVGDSGSTDMSLTVPDTITTWETEAFCLSPQGFGLAPRKTLIVFQPFFLELTLPYSIIRGEQFELKATVFNYLTSCIMVRVSAAPSSDYTLIPLSDEEYTSCLCANERKTFRWTMSPSVLGVVNVTVSAEAVESHLLCDNEIVSAPQRGRMDVVTRPLIVKAEGTETAKTFNWLLCPKGEALTEEVELQLPANVINGSARASVSVLGDILGRALKNLDGLLKMPYGCGEQNMALLAPNIYILQYLKNTQQLTTDIQEKAANFLSSGYQRQLNYKHDDGAYSTFGTGDGITWLTAFVLRSFVKARSFVFIDSAKIEESKFWLESKQQENGCFEQLGKLVHNRMKGGVSDEVTLSAYITAAFLEMNMSATHPAVQRSLSCLKESLSGLNNTYTTALMAYVFTLAGDLDTRALLLKRLDTVALQQGGFLHWSQEGTETSSSLSVEISSYVLMAKLSASPTAEDLLYSTRIVKWLTGQQNQYGGFSSTQDTVVALQALALYATEVFSPEGSSTVTVQSPSSQLAFDLNPNNKLLYQEQALKDMRGKYSVEVKGTACASVQISLQYNIPTPPQVSSLHVETESLANCTRSSRRIHLNVKSIHIGNETNTNMVILDIKILSGFIPDPVALTMLKESNVVDRVEHNEDHVLVYLRELQKAILVHHTVQLIQVLPVQNLKPAVVKIYDYYQPSSQAEMEYTDPCAAAS
uniref:alpha-2-macroglobulin-like n=1 Tax=Semicossyphus pulcher TaxID=241346 RepID=UPI0037E830FF